MHPSYFKPKITVGFQLPSLHKILLLPSLLPVDIRGHAEPKHTCCPQLCQRGPGRKVPVSAPLGLTSLLQATDSPVGSQILSEMYLLNQVTSQSARTVRHAWQCYATTSLLV